MFPKILQQLLFAAAVVSMITTLDAATTNSKSVSHIPAINCATVLCALPSCKPGEIIKIPEGQCCPQCVSNDGDPDCSAVSCLLPTCKEGQELEVPDGECCPVCVPVTPDCSAVSCLLVACEEGEQLEVPEGECCPKCVPQPPDCSTVLCLLPDCEEDEVLEVPEGECCPKCVQASPNCSAIICLKPVCDEDELLVVPEGECCPKCQPIEEECEIEGQEFSTCASLCPRSCDPSPIIICPAVCVEGCACPPGQVIDNDNKRCVDPEDCPKRDPCALVDCLPNSICKVDPATNTPFCEPSCDLNNGGCRDDQLCTLNQVQCFTTPCPPEVVCTDLDIVCSQSPDPGPCRGAFKRYFHNSTSSQCERFVYGGCEGNLNRFETRKECENACETEADPCDVCPKGTICRTEQIFCINPPCGPDRVRCLDPDEVCDLPPVTGPCKALFRRFFYNATTDQCELFIYGGCGGNDNRFDTRSECIAACGADNPCIGVPCALGSACKVDDQTGEAFCEPSCELDNGGCRDDQKCELMTVQCVRAPCPPVVNCVDKDPCATVRCANGYRCEVYKLTGEAFCNPDCNLNNGGCPLDQDCLLQDVVCVRAPCPPIIKCVERGNQTECPPTCSVEFCSANRRALCTNPGPREIPGCTGSCQLTYCHTCYYSDTPQARPDNCPQCDDIRDYLKDTRCFRRWANCVKRRQRTLRRNRDERTEENFRCQNPPCPLHG